MRPQDGENTGAVLAVQIPEGGGVVAATAGRGGAIEGVVNAEVVGGHQRPLVTQVVLGGIALDGDLLVIEPARDVRADVWRGRPGGQVAAEVRSKGDRIDDRWRAGTGSGRDGSGGRRGRGAGSQDKDQEGKEQGSGQDHRSIVGEEEEDRSGRLNRKLKLWQGACRRV